MTRLHCPRRRRAQCRLARRPLLARGRRGQALVDAKARLSDRAFASLRRLRGRRNLFGGRAGLGGPGGRSRRPLAASRRGTQLNRVRPSRAWPASGSATAPPPGAEGGALSCSSSASSPWSCSRSSRSAGSCRADPRKARPSRARHGASGRRGTEPPTSAPARGARKGTGAPHGACQEPLLVAASRAAGAATRVVHSPAAMTARTQVAAPCAPGQAPAVSTPTLRLQGLATTLHRYRPDELELSIVAPHAGWVLVTDRWAAGWRAWVDGREAPVWGGNLLFRVLRVTAGPRRIRFLYRPAGDPGLLIVRRGNASHGRARERRAAAATPTLTTDRPGPARQRPRCCIASVGA